MIEKTLKEIDDKDFQKWWAHHPWCKVRIVDSDNPKQQFYQVNMLSICAAIIAAAGVAVGVLFTDLVKFQQYAYDKNELTEKQIQQKYSQYQVARYEKLVNLRQKMQ